MVVGRYSIGGGFVQSSWAREGAHPSMKTWCVHSRGSGFGWAVGETWMPFRPNTSTPDDSHGPCQYPSVAVVESR